MDEGRPIPAVCAHFIMGMANRVFSNICHISSDSCMNKARHTPFYLYATLPKGEIDMSKSFSDSVHRLIHAIHARNLTIKPFFLQEIKRPFSEAPPKLCRTHFYSNLVGRFGSSNLVLWLEYLNDDNYNPDWYIAEVYFETIPINPNYSLQAYTSREEAITDVLERMESERCLPSNVYIDGDTTIFEGDSCQIASIYPLIFEVINDADNKRAEKTFTNISNDQDDIEIGHALKNINGLDAPIYNRRERVKNPIDTSPVLLNSRTLCHSMHTFLNEVLEENIKLSSAQELLAVFLGFDTWQHFKAKERARGQVIMDPYMVIEESDYSIKPDIKGFYRGLANGAHGFGQHLKRTNQKRYSMHLRSDLCLTNRRINDDDTFIRSGELYDSEGITLQAIPTGCSKHSPLKDSKDWNEDTILSKVNDYLASDKTLVERIIVANSHDKIPNENHLVFDNWIVWLDGRKRYVFFETISKELGQTKFRQSMKRWDDDLIADEDGNIWMSTDHNSGPYTPLPGLTIDNAKTIVKRLLDNNGFNLNNDIRATSKMIRDKNIAYKQD